MKRGQNQGREKGHATLNENTAKNRDRDSDRYRNDRRECGRKIQIGM